MIHNHYNKKFRRKSHSENHYRRVSKQPVWFIVGQVEETTLVGSKRVDNNFLNVIYAEIYSYNN